MSLGSQIRAARKAAGLTQEALAGQIGVKRSVVSKYETGAIEPSVSQLRRIAEALGVSPGFLQGEERRDAQLLRSAVLREDFRAAEQIMGLPDGTLRPLPFSPETPGFRALCAAYSALNEAGQEQAVQRLQELAQLPQYQKEPDGQPD